MGSYKCLWCGSSRGLTRRKKVCRVCHKTEKEADVCMVDIYKRRARKRDIIEEHRAFGAHKERVRNVAQVRDLANHITGGTKDLAEELRALADLIEVGT